MTWTQIISSVNEYYVRGRFSVIKRRQQHLARTGGSSGYFLKMTTDQRLKR
jgi:hypothetical protein